jgi:hypothetical protein
MKRIPKYLLLVIVLLFLTFNYMKACPRTPIAYGAYTTSSILQPGCTIGFTGAASHDRDDICGIYPETWAWDFDYRGTFSSDVSSTSSTANWTYNQAGVYTVALKFTDDDGQSAIYTFPITIS